MGVKQVETAPDEYKNLAELIEELAAVDLNSPLAKLNETTMSDNNGGRILL
jgi:ribulose-5-phosphate 4-epimerase/fuculose-1-phosphate aldolase